MRMRGRRSEEAWRRRRKTAWAAQIVALNLVEVHQVVDAALENE